MKNKGAWLFLQLLFAVLVYFILFQDLGYQPLNVWDESRNAVNALEMLWNHNFVVRHYEGYPDMWEVKPPLLVWLQALSMAIIGHNELAVRLPSALAVVGMIILLIQFFKQEFNRPLLGYLSSLILITSIGFIDDHIARSGDHDALLCFFLSVSAVQYYRYLKHGKSLHLYLTVVSIIGAAYTKSIAALFILPGLLIFTIVQGKVKEVLGNRHFYSSILLFVLVVGSYYAIREYLNPGYIWHVWQLELFHRYTNTSEIYSFMEKSNSYYLLRFLHYRFTYWVPLFLAGILLFLSGKVQKPLKDLLTYSIVLFSSILLIISFGTKKEWYDAPLYFFMAIITGIAIDWIISWLEHKIGSKQNCLFWVIPVLIFAYPYSMAAKKAYKPEPTYADTYFAKLLHQIDKNHPDYKNFTIVHDNYNSHIEFYQLVYNRYKGFDIDRIRPVQGMSKGDTIVFVQDMVYHQVFKEFEVKVIDQYKNCILAELH